MEWYLQVWKKYAVFSGRARRKEFWYFVLFNLVIAIALTVFDNVAGLYISKDTGTGFLSTIYSLAIIIPSLAVEVRRLHDTGRSGWWLLIAFIPLIGAIILLIYLAQDSQAGDNKYGPNPKQATA